jgi:hypothetical protein
MDIMDMKKREGESEDRRKRWEEDNERQRIEMEQLIEEVYPRSFTVDLIVG